MFINHFLLSTKTIHNYFSREFIDQIITYSFVSYAFTKQLNKSHTLINKWFNIITSFNKIIKFRCSIKTSPMKIGDHFLSSNLIILEINDFEVICGMNCLSINLIVLDYHKRYATFQPQNEPNLPSIVQNKNKCFDNLYNEGPTIVE